MKQIVGVILDLAMFAGLMCGMVLCIWLVFAFTANAKEGAWSGANPLTSAWFKDQQFPTAGGMMSCCGEGDAVIADDWSDQPDGSVRAIVTRGIAGVADAGEVFYAPKERVHTQSDNPGGHTWMFVGPRGSGIVWCLIKFGGA